MDNFHNFFTFPVLVVGSILGWILKGQSVMVIVSMNIWNAAKITQMLDIY